MVEEKYCSCGKKIDFRSSNCISCSKKGNDFGKFNKGKIRLDFIGEGNPRWNNGIGITTQGYIEVISNKRNSKNKRGRILQHRKVMEDFLGRKLKRIECIHHINGNKQDNNIKNLELMSSQSEHAKRHSPGEEQRKKISIANKGRIFTKEHRTKLSKSMLGNTNGKRK